MNPELIEKYDRPGPRYTSYPPVPFWENTPGPLEWADHVRKAYAKEGSLDLYVHVPFCQSLCYYCGCTREIRKTHEGDEAFIMTLLKEWSLYKEILGMAPVVRALHFGGGTPTFLRAKDLRRIVSSLTEKRTEDFEISIEVDPRTCTPEHLDMMRAEGIKRVSLGVQDFDPEVQAAIHRFQPPKLVSDLVSRLREIGILSINFDLIYGLPRQSDASIRDTIEKVKASLPETIALYGYAHLPDRIKNQRLINNWEVPQGKRKRDLYELAKNLLIKAGYLEIGMDHFARKESELARAYLSKTIHRNFMGYVVRRSSLLLGLGPSSISDSSLSYTQNAKKSSEWMEMIEAGKLAISGGHLHTPEDLESRKVIQNLMCHGEILAKDLSDPGMAEELLEFIDDGILSFNGSHYVLTGEGHPFMRNVAMALDHRLAGIKNSTHRFSRTI